MCPDTPLSLGRSYNILEPTSEKTRLFNLFSVYVA